MDDLISVIIPFYNRLDLVKNSIESVLNQTYHNYEIILIDDGSTEDVAEMKACFSEDTRLKWITQKNTGVAAARNVGIAAAEGEYIAFLDSDDLFKSEKLEKQLWLMKENKAVISHTSYDQIDMNGEKLNTVDFGKYSGKLFPQILSICPIATPTVMMKREVLNGMKEPFNTAFHIGEDICLWIDLAHQHEILGIEEPLTQVRIGDASAFQNNDKQKIGLLNILNHEIRNPAYRVYEKEIAYLIKTLLGQFETVPEKVCIKGIRKYLYYAGRLLVTLSEDGISTAIRRVARKLGKHV